MSADPELLNDLIGFHAFMATLKSSVDYINYGSTDGSFSALRSYPPTVLPTTKTANASGGARCRCIPWMRMANALPWTMPFRNEHIP